MFAGVGGFREGLTAAGGFSCVGHCEIDAHANKSYNALFDTKGEFFCEDAHQIDPASLPDFDLLCRGFPCQAFSVAGKAEWNKETIQRILQNEKYMGDVLLQKTYTADFLSGTVKKNNGELAQYYITDSHPGIVSKEVFHCVQEEIARRKSKRLVCAECGCYYRRVTWSIHGRKEIVWRCINRLEFGKKYCPHSPTIKEESLHASIVAAMQQAAAMSSHELENALQCALGQADIAAQTSASDPLLLQNKIAEKNAEFDRLLGMSAHSDDESEFLDARIKQINDEILQLRQMKKQAELTATETHQAEPNTSIRENVNSDLSEYNDTLTARTVERITVKQDSCLTLQFVDGSSIILQIEK